MNADYQRIAARTFALCKMLEETELVKVIAPAGTNIVSPSREGKHTQVPGCSGRKVSRAIYPTGEAYLAPLEGVSNGVVVVDGSVAMIWRCPYTDSNYC